MTKAAKLDEPLFYCADGRDGEQALAMALAPIGVNARAFADLEALISAAASERPFAVLLCTRSSTGRDAAIAKAKEAVPGVPVAGFDVPLTDALCGWIDSVVTERIAAMAQEAEEIAFLTKTFTEEALEILQDIDPLIMRLEAIPLDRKVVDLIYRKIHTVKGGSGVTPKAVFIGKLCHEFESCLNALKSGALQAGPADVNLFLSCADLVRKLGYFLRDAVAIAKDTIDLVNGSIERLKELRENGARPVQVSASSAPLMRAVEPSDTANGEEEGVFVGNDRLDDFIKLSGEFIIFKNYFEIFCREGASGDNCEEAKASLKGFSQSINKLTSRLQEQIMEVRKVALSRAFSKLPRMVRQTCQDLGKRVKLVQTGLDLGVDKSVAKALGGAMTHMVRNSLDHGMETPAERLRAGKAEEGSVRLAASEARGVISVVVRDDGRGINKKRVLAKAIQNGLVSEAASALLSDPEIYDLLFLPGFSTAEKVTDVSGRGVGMDVVRSTVTSLGGKIEIKSSEGVGTEITIDIPIPKTVVIEKTVVVQSGAHFFAIPIAAIAKIDSASAFPVTRVGERLTTQFDGRTIRVGNYADFVGTGRQRDLATTQGSLLVLQYKSERLGLLVDAVKSQLEAVVRPFDGITKHVYGCKGTTIMGASRIAYVLSPEEFVGQTHDAGASPLSEGAKARLRS